MSLTTTRSFYYDDAGASQLEGSGTDLCTILKACLVTGYGSILPVGGWSVLKEEVGRIVFKNSLAHGGTGCAVILTETSTTVASLECGSDYDVDTDTLSNSTGSRTFTTFAGTGGVRRWAGRNVILINEAYTTQACSACGCLSGPTGRSGLVVREWQCGDCGASHDRDVNAAINICHLGMKHHPPSAGTSQI